jgi:hypothetical protein
MGLGTNIKRWAHGKQKLRQLFNPDPRYASLAFEAFDWYLRYSGIQPTNALLEQAREEAAKYPSINIKQFVEGLGNKKMRDMLGDL